MSAPDSPAPQPRACHCCRSAGRSTPRTCAARAARCGSLMASHVGEQVVLAVAAQKIGEGNRIGHGRLATAARAGVRKEKGARPFRRTGANCWAASPVPHEQGHTIHDHAPDDQRRRPQQQPRGVRPPRVNVPRDAADECHRDRLEAD